MEPPSTRAWNYLPIVPAIASATVLAGYLGIMRHQGDDPVLWFIAGLALAAGASVYGVWRRAPLRGVALAVAGIVLVGCGLAALFSVGLPLVVAGGVALVAAGRGDR